MPSTSSDTPEKCQPKCEPLYLLVLKANHGNAYAAVQRHFEQHCFGRNATAQAVFDAFDESHGRLGCVDTESIRS
jgi:hypothetical protein